MNTPTKQTAFTAGQWTYKPTASLGPQYAVYSEADTRGADIAIVYDHGEAEANARLIASSPTMYEALEADLHDLQDIANYVRGLDGNPDEIKHCLNLIGGRVAAIKSTLAEARGQL